MPARSIRIAIIAVAMVAFSALVVIAATTDLIVNDVALPGLTDDAVVAEGEGDVGEVRAPGLVLHLPTGNDAVLRDEPHAFYQGLNTTVPGLRPERWMGGQYGFVRNVAPTPAGQTFTRVHQGVDIQPLYRNAQGVPLDTVRAIDAGTVVHVNRGAGASNYGRYVVLRHEWDGADVYSLYAHMETVTVNNGDELPGGADIGRMGYTGTGLNRDRAHVHLEVAFMLNTHYQLFHDTFFGGANLHGLFFGRNLMGVDPSALYLGIQDDPSLTFEAFIRQKPVAYRLAIPGHRPLDFLKRYPWLGVNGTTAEDAGGPGAWVVGFTREGVPIEVDRRPQDVTLPEVAYVADEVRRRHLSTGGYLARTLEGQYTLTRAGLAHAALLATGPDGVPPWF